MKNIDDKFIEEDMEKLSWMGIYKELFEMKLKGKLGKQKFTNI